MSGLNKVPPVFREDTDDYDQWKKDLDIWKFVTDIPEAKVAATILLSLTGRARQATNEISVKTQLENMDLNY